MKALCEWVLKRKADSVKRVKAYHNFESAKLVGVVFNAEDEGSYLASIDFITYLNNKGIRVKAIGFLRGKERLNHFPYTKGVKYSSYSEISLFSATKNIDILGFINTKFDILIDISQTEHFAIKSIIALSKSKLRVTSFIEDYLFDFQINVGRDKPVDFVAKQIVLYLGNIQKAG